MKNYKVTLTATSCKTVTLSAESEKAAKKLAGDLYFSSDMLDFNNDDIDEVSIEVNEIENPNERLSELISDIQIAVNEARLSIEDVQRTLDNMLEYTREKCAALS